MSNQTKNATLVGGGGQKPLNSQSLETKEILKSKIQDSKIQLESNSPKLKDSNSKLESSKVKSLIRTIPISVTLAMALSSQMAVADITAQAGGEILYNGSIINTGTTVISQSEIMQGTTVTGGGNSGTILNATIVNGTIINGTSYTVLYKVSNDTKNGTIINGWNFRDSATGTLNNSGTVVVSKDFTSHAMPISVLIGKAGDLLIDSGVTITGTGTNGAVSNGVVFVGLNAQAGIITNKGTITGANKNIAVGNSGIAEAIINEGLIRVVGSDNFGIMGWGNSTITNITNTGTITGAATRGLIGLEGSTVGTLTINGGVLNHTNNGDAIKMVRANGANKETSVNAITINGGASITGNIRIQNASNVGTMVISGANNLGTATQITGDINLANTSTITNGITLSDTANITGTINLTEKGYIDTLSLNQGTITGGISLTGNGTGATGSNTATIGEITLANNSTITESIIVKGNSATNNAKIGSITLESGTGIGGSIAVGDNTAKGIIDTIILKGNASIGGITGNNGIISTLTLGETSSIGTIVNSATIANLNLSKNGTITNGITNAANGNIGTITSNTNDGVSNTITNHGTIRSLEVTNQGTIVYRSDNGIITDALSVASGATLAIKDSTGSSTGTIELKSDGLTFNGSTLDLATDSTLEGHLKNSGNLGHWTNESNIRGHFINTGTIGELNAGNIAEYLENTSTGVIQTLTEGKITGTLNNTGTIGELNTSVINYTNGNANTATIAGAGHYGILNIDKDTIMDNNNTITNALNVQNNNNNGYTLTINNGGSGNGTLYFNSTNGTIDNAGTILGNIDNQTDSIIKTFNTGSISGSIINNNIIQELNVTGNVTNGITNNSNIGSLIVEESVNYSGNGSDRITQALIVEKDKTLTIGSGSDTLNFHATNGTINNAGTINGNITNIADSILTDFTNSGSISGTFTNEGHIVKFVNESTGSINNFVNDNTISFFENNGIITSFNGNNGTIYGVINSKTITNGFENVATSLWNKENALITGNVALKGDYKDCSNSGSTICNTSDLINEGTITGNVTNGAGKEINLVENTGTIGGSIANSGSINTLEVSGDIAGGITNNSNIGTFIVNESVTYKGNGNGSDRITQALEVAKDKTLTIGNNGTLSFNSTTNGTIDNAGIIAGNLSNVSNSTLGTFINSGTINGNINNEGTITSIDNSGIITGEIISGSSGQTSQIDKIINTGTIGTAKTKVATFKTLVASNQDASSNFNDAISLNTITTTKISNEGLINGNIRVKGQSDIQELNNTDTIDGCIILEGGRIGKINNANGAIADCMSFSNGASVDNLNNDGTVSGTITNNSGNITVNNSGSISGITTSNGGTTNISNGGFQNSGGNIGLITNTGSNSTTNIIEWNVGNPDNPKSPIKVAGTNLGGINTGTIYVDATPGKVYDVEQIVIGEDGDGADSNGNSLADQLNNGQGIFDSLHHASDIITIIDEGGGEFSAGVDTQELSGKTLGASLIYSSRMRQIDTNNMLREINVKNFKTDFEIL
ncbi:S-layer family protein, partial [Helicobacter pullorum NCTC 12824]